MIMMIRVDLRVSKTIHAFPWEYIMYIIENKQKFIRYVLDMNDSFRL